MAKHERLSVLDEMFLHLENHSSHMHVGAAIIFDGPPPDFQEFLDSARLRLQKVPRFRQKLRTVPFGLGRPVWVDDMHFNLEYHIRHTALPSPGNDEKLKALTARIMSQRLDRSKPLWEIWFAEGLSNDRWALISKTHHALVDGVSGADLMTVILDLTPESEKLEPEHWIPDPEPTADQLLAEAVRERITSPAELIRSAQSTAMDPRRVPNRIVEAARALGAFVGGSLDFAPDSTLNAQIGPHRRFETVLSDLNDLKHVKNSLGGTVNDVVLAAVAGGLRHLLKNRGERLEGLELRAMVPVSVRAEEGRGALGNQVASIWAPLPVFEEDPVARLHWVSAKMKDLKSSGQAVGAQVLTSLGEWAPPTVLAQASRLVSRQRAYNLVVTNVPGPQFPLYSMGCEMKEVYPVVPLTNNTSLVVGLISYNGSVCWGILGDYDAVKDIGVLAEGIEKSVAELLAAAG